MAVYFDPCGEKTMTVLDGECRLCVGEEYVTLSLRHHIGNIDVVSANGTEGKVPSLVGSRGMIFPYYYP